MDNDNNEAVWMKSGPPSALNMSVSLMTIFHQKLLEIVDDKTITKDILNYLLNAVEGQYIDLNGVHNTSQYIEMVKLKCGSLICLTNILGLSFAERDYRYIVEDYSYDLGIIAQIENDIQDVYKFDEKSDWRLKKKTLPILYLLNPLIVEGEIVRKYYSNQITFEEFLSHKDTIISNLKAVGAINYALTKKYIYEHRALNKIESLPIDPKKKGYLFKNLLNKTNI